MWKRERRQERKMAWVWRHFVKKKKEGYYGDSNILLPSQYVKIHVQQILA